MLLDDIINQMQDELYIKMIIKELLDDCDLEELNIISELNKKDKNRVIKVIKKQGKSIADLKKYLLKNDFLVSNDNMTRNYRYMGCDRGVITFI